MNRFVPAGIITPIAVPLKMDLTVDHASLRKVVRFLIDGGVDGLFPAVTAGEFFDITPEDFRTVLETIKNEASDKAKVYATASGTAMKSVLDSLRIAGTVGTDAVFAPPPMFVSITQSQLISHFQAVAGNTDLPVIVYDNQPKDGARLTPYTVQKLSRIPNIVAIKESLGDMQIVDEYLRLTKGTGFSVLTSRNSLVYAGLCYGASGAVVPSSHIFPELVTDVYDKFISGDTSGAQDAQQKISRFKSMFRGRAYSSVIKESLSLINSEISECYTYADNLPPEERERVLQILSSTGLVSADEQTAENA